MDRSASRGFVRTRPFRRRRLLIEQLSARILLTADLLTANETTAPPRG